MRITFTLLCLLTGFMSCEKNESNPPSARSIKVDLGEQKSWSVGDGEIAILNKWKV
jgi:hypothetical protein